MNSYNTADFIKKCRQFGLNLSDQQLSQFMEYYKLLVEWNSFMNLTAITDFDEVVLKHFTDSLAIYQYSEFRKFFNSVNNAIDTIHIVNDNIAMNDTNARKDMKDIVSLIDVGTGAGFPGIPLKIMFPELKITLLDSLQKRIHFLDTVIEKLDLKDITTIHGRAEDYGKNSKYREQYNFCVSRAVANLSVLSELCIPFVKKNGYFIAYKSEKVKEELTGSEKAISVLGGKAENQLEYKLPDSDINRALLLIKKIEATPKQYPRKAGIPEKRPI